MMRPWPQSLRWAACFSLALAFHGAGAAALLARWNENSDLMPNAPVVMLDLAPETVAPITTPTETPPDIVESKLVEPVVEPEPEQPKPVVELPPDPVPQPELTAIPPPKPPEKKVEKKPRREASIARTPTAADKKAERSAAAASGAGSRDPNAVPSWKSQLVSQLERYKRYPSEAQSRGDKGVTQVAFSIDRGGGVHNVRIVGSSGSSILDQETLSLVQRASPLPAPPPEMGGSNIPIVVPIRYNTR